MTGTNVLAWVLLAVWAAWLHVVQGLVAHGPLGAWTPDLGLCLFVALAPRVSAGDIAKVALVAALARATFSVDAPVAIAAAYLAAALLAEGLRAVIDLRSVIFRTVFAAALAPALATWLGLAHEVRVAGALQFAAAGSSPGAASVWGVALSSGLVALALTPVLARLPGLSPLLRRREWHLVASYR